MYFIFQNQFSIKCGYIYSYIRIYYKYIKHILCNIYRGEWYTQYNNTTLSSHRSNVRFFKVKIFKFFTCKHVFTYIWSISKLCVIIFNINLNQYFYRFQTNFSNLPKILKKWFFKKVLLFSKNQKLHKKVYIFVQFLIFWLPS